MIDVYYKPSDIHFSREQMFWLISVLPYLEEGSWPINPHETGYTEAENTGRVNTSAHAPFEGPAQIYAEVTYRLALTGKDGKMLYWEIQQGKVEEYVGLCPSSKQALNFVSGWRRRKTDYRHWKYQHYIKSDNCHKPHPPVEAIA
jgi:hypothetical protein